MADRVPDEGLPPQDQEVAGESTGDGSEDSDQKGGQAELDEFRVHHIIPPRSAGRPIRRSISAISSFVSTVSIGVRPS